MGVDAGVDPALQGRPQAVAQARAVARDDVLVRPRALEVEHPGDSAGAAEQQRGGGVQREVGVQQLGAGARPRRGPPEAEQPPWQRCRGPAITATAAGASSAGPITTPRTSWSCSNRAR